MDIVSSTRGYVKAELKFSDLRTKAVDALFLVVPDTGYHSSVPVLVGTNILRSVVSPDSRNVSTAWRLAMQSLSAQDKVCSCTDSLGQIKTTKAVTIPADSRITVSGLTCAASATCTQINVLMEDSDIARLPGGLMITPGLRTLKPARAVERVAVEVTNMSGHAVTLPAKSCLCKLHHIDVIPPNKSQTDNPARDDFRNKFVES